MLTRRNFFRGTSLGAGGLFFGNFLSQLEAVAADNSDFASILGSGQFENLAAGASALSTISPIRPFAP